MKRFFSTGVALIAMSLANSVYAADAPLLAKTRISLERQASPGPMRYYGGPKSPMWRAAAEDSLAAACPRSPVKGRWARLHSAATPIVG